MPVIRLIYVTVDSARIGEAERIWKTECAPLMIRQPGCLSEQLLKCVDPPGEMISYSEWADQPSIEAYLTSAAHDEIRRHSRGLQSIGRPVVKLYEVAG